MAANLRNALVAIAVREAVVDALAEAGLADDAQGRSLLVKTVSDNLAHPLKIPDQPVGRHHLIELVSACARTAGGTAAFMLAVRLLLQPGSSQYQRIRRLVEEPRVLELVAVSELDQLREWLVGIAIPQLPRLVRRAAGPGIPAARPGGNAWEAFSYLSEFNAGADGFPPALSFVELLARQVGGEIGANLTTWNSDQSRTLGLEPELQARRAADQPPIAVDSRLYLMIVVQHDGIDPNRFLLSHWRQDDPTEWPPVPGETGLVGLDELERSVDELVVGAERAWSDLGHAVALEFVLPRALLNLPVHRWSKELDSGQPRPLCMEYPVVVRSLERMRSPHWRRVWRRRWQALTDDPAAAGVYFAQPKDATNQHRIEAVLSDPRWVLMVLAASPSNEPLPGTDELTAALRSGLPALIWHPVASAEALREIVSQLLADGGLADLPQRTLTLRQSSFRMPSTDNKLDIGRDLVVLWDDPRRLVNLDQPAGPLRSWEGAADEYGRTS